MKCSWEDDECGAEAHVDEECRSVYCAAHMAIVDLANEDDDALWVSLPRSRYVNALLAIVGTPWEQWGNEPFCPACGSLMDEGAAEHEATCAWLIAAKALEIA